MAKNKTELNGMCEVMVAALSEIHNDITFLLGLLKVYMSDDDFELIPEAETLYEKFTAKYGINMDDIDMVAEELVNEEK